MDNQNENDGGFPQQSPPLIDNQAPDEQNQNQENATNINPSELENLRTQSVVESSRDVAEKELAAQEAYNQQIIHNQQVAIRRDKEKRTAVKVVLIILSILITAALIWLVFLIIIAMRPPADDNPDGGGGDSTILSTVDGYQCKTEKCKKMTDLPDGRIIIQDTSYYIYDISKKTATPTTINSSIEYLSMTSFTWGKNEYFVILKPEIGNYGLFKVSSNSQIISNSVTEFYTDTKHVAYKDMTSVYGKNIIARVGDRYYLYDVRDGSEIAHGALGVFCYSKYVIGYEENGVRFVYNSNGDQLFSTQSTDELYIRDRYIIKISKSMDVYDQFGTKQTSSTNSIVKELQKIKNKERITTLNKNKKYYHLPTTRKYE